MNSVMSTQQMPPVQVKEEDDEAKIRGWCWKKMTPSTLTSRCRAGGTRWRDCGVAAVRGSARQLFRRPIRNNVPAFGASVGRSPHSSPCRCAERVPLALHRCRPWNPAPRNSLRSHSEKKTIKHRTSLQHSARVGPFCR